MKARSTPSLYDLDSSDEPGSRVSSWGFRTLPTLRGEDAGYLSTGDDANFASELPGLFHGGSSSVEQLRHFAFMWFGAW